MFGRDLFRRAVAACIDVGRPLLVVALLQAGAAQAAPKEPFELLHQFDAPTDGRGAAEGLVLGPDGRFYAVNALEGALGGGTAYAVDKHGVFTVLHAFNPWIEGSEAHGRLVSASDGSLYGVLSGGGAHGCGSIFRMSPSDGATEILHSFVRGAEGCKPLGGIVQGPDGVFYGTTSEGGAYQWGTVFRWAPGQRARVLHHFTHSDGDGGYPLRGVTMSADGLAVYGVTYRGGAQDSGVIFKVGTDGTDYSVLRSFDDKIGLSASGELVLAKDGNFYGPTARGGAGHYGTIYRLTPAGDVSVMHSFVSFSDVGQNPAGRLTLGEHGMLYGTTTYGGANAQGTIFALSRDGVMTVMHSFAADEFGFNAGGNLARAHGYLYGVTGNRGWPLPTAGTVFRIRKLEPGNEATSGGAL
ncbi:MAG TPA: choice-of-anchor tandem repeat GloVer-containing protein [Ideonella sp.]|nr:choice-of-anchor tandem repeat GloVer-containing protein [Ideonella sp.]